MGDEREGGAAATTDKKANDIHERKCAFVYIDRLFVGGRSSATDLSLLNGSHYATHSIYTPHTHTHKHKQETKKREEMRGEEIPVWDCGFGLGLGLGLGLRLGLGLGLTLELGLVLELGLKLGLELDCDWIGIEIVGHWAHFQHSL